MDQHPAGPQDHPDSWSAPSDSRPFDSSGSKIIDILEEGRQSLDKGENGANYIGYQMMYLWFEVHCALEFQMGPQALQAGAHASTYM